MKLKDVPVGEVCFFYNQKITPAKMKLQVCVSRNVFFQINTDPDFRVPKKSWVVLQQADYRNFLTHDSHVSTSRLFEYNGNFSLPDNNRKGPLSRNSLEQIIGALPNVPTLNAIQVDQIQASLKARLQEPPYPPKENAGTPL